MASNTTLLIPKIKPGTWLSRPCGNISGNSLATQHHFISIHPLLSIAYNGKHVVLESHFNQIEEDIYINLHYFKDWKIHGVPNDKNAAETCMTRALRRYGERDYDLFRNNCEHFATHCFEGISYSTQVREPVTTTAATVTSTGIGSLIGAAFVPATIYPAAIWPAATLLGSEALGSLGVWAGVISAPAAIVPAAIVSVAWPFIAGGVAVGGLAGFISCKLVQDVMKKSTSYTNKQEKKGDETVRDALLVLEMILNRIEDAKKYQNDADALRNDLEPILDKYWF